MEKNYVGGDIDNIVVPKVYEVGAKGDEGDSLKYGGKVWKFLNDMKSTDIKLPGNYDKFLKKVEKIFKENSGNKAPNYDIVFCFQNPNFLEPLRKECKNYLSKGKDQKRKVKIENFLKDLNIFEGRITGNVFYDNLYLKQGKDLRRNSIDYEIVYLDGKAWENTDTEIFKGKKTLKKVILGECVKFINEGTFKNCSNLKEVEVKSDNLNVEKNAFEGCTSLKESGVYGKKGAKSIKEVLNKA